MEPKRKRANMSKEANKNQDQLGKVLALNSTTTSTVQPTIGSSVSMTQLTTELVNENITSHVAYNEMADVPVHFIDPVAEVQKNLAHLLEVHSRMKFMMKEVRFLLKV
jgi:hypothetical protein